MNAHRTNIKRTTRTYQLAAGAALSCGVAAVALPLAKELGPPPPAPKRISTGEQQAPAPTPRAMALDDAAGVITRLIGWRKEAAVEPEKPAVAVAPSEVKPPTPAPVSTEWAYLGSVLSGTSRHALIRVQENQHMLKEGGSLENTKLVKIDPRAITLENASGERREIALLERASPFPTDPPKRPVVTRGATGMPGAMTQNGMNPQPVPGRPPPQTFDQARIAAEEAAKRARSGRNDEQLRNLGPDAGERILKMMGDGNLGVADRARLLGHFGIQPGTSPEEAMERLRQSGITPDDNPGMIEAIKHNASGDK